VSEPSAKSQMFPILDANAFVPWAFVAPHEKWALNNHDQTLKRLAERGGLDWCELCAVIENRRWQAMDVQGNKNAVARVMGHLVKWYDARLDTIREEERERCAKIAGSHELDESELQTAHAGGWQEACRDIAKAIRA